VLPLVEKVFLADISTPGAPKVTLANEAIAISESPGMLRLHLVNWRNPRECSPEQINFHLHLCESDLPIQVPSVQNKAPKEIAPIPELTTSDLLGARVTVPIHCGALVLDRISPPSGPAHCLQSCWH